MLIRFPDWPSRLEAYLLAARASTFRYSVNDCCTFALDAVQAITGHDFASPYLAYSSYREGYRMIREKYGAKTLRGFLTETVLADLPPIPKGFQQRGDLVLVHRGAKTHNNQYALAIVGLDGFPAVMDAVGYRVMSNESVDRGWRV